MTVRCATKQKKENEKNNRKTVGENGKKKHEKDKKMLFFSNFKVYP